MGRIVVAAEEEEACHWLLFLPTATKAPPVWERKAPPVWKKKAHFWERKAPVWVTRMWAAGAACHRLPLSSSLPPQPELAMKAPRCCFGELPLHCKRLIVFFVFFCLLAACFFPRRLPPGFCCPDDATLVVVKVFVLFCFCFFNC